MVPHLITALSGPLNELEQRILDSTSVIERWFRLEWMEHTPPFYAAVDVRNAGFKLAPVDTNLFPGCWNALTPAMLPLAVQAAQVAIEKICPEARNLLIVPENNVRSALNLNNLAQLRQIFTMAGLHVRMGSIDPAITHSTRLELPGGGHLTLEPVLRQKGRLVLKDFDPCTILLNNDLRAGVPGILEDLHEQYLLPPLHASWTTRRKSTHFGVYEEVAKRFGKLIGVDHWLITPMFEAYGVADLHSHEGLEALTTRADAMLNKIRKKYKEYGIKERPFLVIKADNCSSANTILSVRDTKGLQDKLRTMGTHAEPSAAPLELMLQEGVLTHERIDDAVAEPVVYLMDRHVVGGFYRMHAQRGEDEILSAPGARFFPLAFAESVQLPQPGVRPGASAPNRFYMYGVIGRLAMLAASYELEATDPEAEPLD